MSAWAKPLDLRGLVVVHEAHPDHTAGLGQAEGTDQLVGIVVAVPDGDAAPAQLGGHLAGRAAGQREGERGNSLVHPGRVDDAAQVQTRHLAEGCQRLQRQVSLRLSDGSHGGTQCPAPVRGRTSAPPNSRPSHSR